jgi:hypothetical protein
MNSEAECGGIKEGELHLKRDAEVAVFYLSHLTSLQYYDE